MTDMQIVRGETKEFVLSIVDANGDPLVLADKRIYFTSRLGDVVVHAKRTANAGGSTDEIEVLGDGSATLKFAQGDTASMDPCKLDCDVWVVKDDESEYTRVLAFRLRVVQAQTRSFPTS